jgi:hypothetical protein
MDVTGDHHVKWNKLRSEEQQSHDLICTHIHIYTYIYIYTIIILCIYIYVYIYIYREREREREIENMTVIMGLSEGTTGRWKRKREYGITKCTERYCIIR